MTSPCATCTLGCCRYYLVTITGYDAWVIANGMQLAPEQFLITVPQKVPSNRGFLLDRSEQTYDIALDKVPVEGNEKPCIFWLEMPSGVGRCGIYSLRPYVCQTYPAYFVDGEVTRRDDVLCPNEAWHDGTLQQDIWRDRLQRMQVEFDIYGLAVARWNYHVSHTPHLEKISVLGYYTYLMNFYTCLAPLRQQLNAVEWQAMCKSWSAACFKNRSPLAEKIDEMAPWATVIDGIRSVANHFFPNDVFPDGVPTSPENASSIARSSNSR
jgi:Fe-S-cluster containining protein